MSMDATAIYIGMVGSLQKVADAVAPLVGAVWTEAREGGFHCMEWQTQGCWVELCRHEFDDDKGLPFTQYPFEMAVYTRDSDVRVSLVREMFDKLKAINSPMMLVDRDQNKLDEWHPTK